MDPNVTLTITVPSSLAEEFLALARGLLALFPDGISISAAADSSPMKNNDDAPFQTEAVERPLRYLLTGRVKKMAEYIVGRNGQFYNDELATELGVVDAMATSGVLNAMTKRLRRVGIKAEGSKGVNWYTKDRANRRTLITVRADVVRELKVAIGTA